jgi:hypothetical protein
MSGSFLTSLLHLSIYVPCNKNKCPNLIWKHGPNVLPNQFKTQMIKFYVQIYILAKINALINICDQANEISEHITFKRRLVVIIHVVYIPFTNLNCCYEITNKRNFANLNKKLLPLKMSSPHSTPTMFSH